MDFIDIVEWLWPFWRWALPLILIPFIVFLYLSFTLENPVSYQLINERLQKEYHFSLQEKEPRSKEWSLSNYRKHPSLYTNVVNFIRLLSDSLLVVLAMTTREPILMGMVTFTVLIPIHIYGTIKYPTIEERANRRFNGIIEGGFLDEMRILRIRSSEQPKVIFEQVLQELLSTEKEPKEAIRSFLWTIKMMKKKDEISRLAEQKIKELGLEIPP